jgi:hypothetical protein
MKALRKKKIETKCERVSESDEFYLLTFKTHNEKLEAKVDKENLRHMIQTIDNAII